LTADQIAKSMTLKFGTVSSFELDVDLTGMDNKDGRNVLFSFIHEVDHCVEAIQTTTLPPKATTTVDGSEKCVMCGAECCPEPTTTTPCETQSCQVWADPHVSGFDNTENQGPDSLALISVGGEMQTKSRSFDGRPVDVNAYDTGDFWLVKSEPVHIQARFRLSGEFVPDKAAIGAVAVGGPFLKGHRFVVEALDGKVTFDGKMISLGNSAHSELLTLRQTADTVEADLPMGVTLLLRRLNKHVDVKITMPQIPGGVDGECGNYDGIGENDGEENIEARMNSLMIDRAALLFEEEDSQPTDTGVKSSNSAESYLAQSNYAVEDENDDMPMQLSASHWGSAGTCKVTDDTYFSVFDGVKANVSSNVSLLEADIDTDTDTDTDSGFTLTDFLDGGRAKDLWLVRGRAHDGSTVRVAARYWRNSTSDGHQVFLKSLAISGGFITNRTLVIRPKQDDITWNNQKETYAILKNEESAFSIAGLVNATRSGSTVELKLPKEVRMLVTMHQKFVNVAITMPPLAVQDGLCGNFNGDSKDDTLGMILSRGPGVKDEHSLFPAEWVPPKAAAAPLDEQMLAATPGVASDMDQ
jgi:hypothetical protein